MCISVGHSPRHLWQGWVERPEVGLLALNRLPMALLRVPLDLRSARCCCGLRSPTRCRSGRTLRMATSDPNVAPLPRTRGLGDRGEWPSDEPFSMAGDRLAKDLVTGPAGTPSAPPLHHDKSPYRYGASNRYGASIESDKPAPESSARGRPARGASLSSAQCPSVLTTSLICRRSRVPSMRSPDGATTRSRPFTYR